RGPPPSPRAVALAADVTGPRPADRARRTVRALLRLAPLTITGFMQFSWFGSLAVSPDPYAIVRRDWHQFFETGHQLVAGDLSAIYPRTFESGYFWLYPPYCIYLTALLGIKPNLAIFFVAGSLLARQWRVLAGMGLGGATMVLGSLPLGLERWHEYVHTSRDYVSVVQNKTLMWKQLTLYAFWRTATGGTSSDLAVVAPWLASVAVVLGVTMLAWWRRRD